MPGRVLAVAADGRHRFSKSPVREIMLVAGMGVAGDAHLGQRVQHRSRVAIDPDQPNLRQVHLIHAELFDALAIEGFVVAPGDLGENIATRAIDLLALPRDTILRIGADAVVQLTGLRNPCGQIERFQPGLLAAVLGKARDGTVIRKAGVMAIVLAGGAIRPGDRIAAELPPPPYRPLAPV